MRTPFVLFLTALLVTAMAQPALSADKPVTLVEDGRSFTLTNEYVTARIEKQTGVLTSLIYRNLEMLGKASGSPFAYWSSVGGATLGERREASALVNPSTNGGERAIVSCRFGGGGRSPLDMDIRYALGRADQGIYTYAIWNHPAEYPRFSIAEARFAMKLNEQLFDYMTIDANRSKVMPTPSDWDKGTPLNMKEARRLTTGIYAGQAEHKYDYSAIQYEIPAFGWSSSQHKLGLWMINPSIEYLSGGPTKVELTGHLDVNTGAAPTLLNYWKGSHYGGSYLAVAKGEAWTRFIGPMLVYCNSAPTHEAMWKDALAKAAREAKAWPYDWAVEPQYPGKAQRGAVKGALTVKDPLVPMSKVRNMLVGLTPQSSASGQPVDWQMDAKYYQFWARADEQGRFQVVNIRPGAYTLRAIADGVLGEYSQPNIIVTAGNTLDVGQREWTPLRLGRQLWEIGIPNRSAEEFRHGDHYWEWGLYYQYPKEFPQDVHYVIGKSNPRIDWNYVQPPRLEGNRASPTTWSITFDLPEAPKGQAILRLAFAGSRGRGGIEVSVNDKPAGATGPLPDTGVMHRDGIRGYWFERKVSFDASLMKAGTNVLKLHNPARTWVEGVLYDYLRLELDESGLSKGK
jgi:rhamnogalacturonan endolyase